MFFVLCTVSLFTFVFGASKNINVQESCGSVIKLNPRDTPNGYIEVNDQGLEERACKVTIQCEGDCVIDIRLFEVNFPSCSQSELSVISVLGPNEEDQYPTFSTYPHFCGQKFNPDVVLEQSGEKEWQFILKSKPEKVLSQAKLAFSAHQPGNEPVWPSNEQSTPVPDTGVTDLSKPTEEPIKSVIFSSSAPEETVELTKQNTPSTTITEDGTTIVESKTVLVTGLSTSSPVKTDPRSSPKYVSTTPVFRRQPSTASTFRRTFQTTTAAPKPTFRCFCPASLSFPNNTLITGGPILNSTFYFNINPWLRSSKCNDPAVISSCQQQCDNYAWMNPFYSRFHSRTIVRLTSNQSAALGDAVCNLSTQDYTNVMLTMHSHIAECNGSGISTKPVTVLDSRFSCYNRRFCSLNYPRPAADNVSCPGVTKSPLMLTTLKTSTEKRTTPTTLKTSTEKRTTPTTTPKTATPKIPNRCSCELGVYKELYGIIKIVDLSKIIASTIINGSKCSEEISSCHDYCRDKGLPQGVPSLLSSTVSNKTLVDVPCDGSSPLLTRQNELYLYSHVSFCKESYYTRRNQRSQVVRLSSSFCCSGMSKVPCKGGDIIG